MALKKYMTKLSTKQERGLWNMEQHSELFWGWPRTPFAPTRTADLLRASWLGFGASFSGRVLVPRCLLCPPPDLI